MQAGKPREKWVFANKLKCMDLLLALWSMVGERELVMRFPFSIHPFWGNFYCNFIFFKHPLVLSLWHCIFCHTDAKLYDCTCQSRNCTLWNKGIKLKESLKNRETLRWPKFPSLLPASLDHSPHVQVQTTNSLRLLWGWSMAWRWKCVWKWVIKGLPSLQQFITAPGVLSCMGYTSA